MLVVLIVGAVAIGLAQLGYALFNRAPLPPRQRPTLLLLTSLPLIFGEDFSIDGRGSPAARALQSRYRVLPISVTNPAELAKGRVLLMAQPIAQPAEDLVALDAWVRDGGRLLLLADPMLEWPSKRPLGDPLRPPAMFMDTGLLGHWGLRLDAPGRRGPATGNWADMQSRRFRRGACWAMRDRRRPALCSLPHRQGPGDDRRRRRFARRRSA